MNTPLKKYLGTALLATVLLSGCGGSQEQAQQGGMPVKVAPPTQQKLTEWDEFTGRFQARERVEIRARVSGYLDQIKFADGQMVKKDDVLFVIDQRPFQIALDRAEASLDVAKKEYDRTKNLRKTNAVSETDKDKAWQAYREAKAAYDEAKLNLEFTEVKSPISGRASRNLVDVGNLINGGDLNATLLTTVVNMDPIDFYFEVSERDVLKYMRLEQKNGGENIATARPAMLKLQDEKEYTHRGTVDFVDNEVDRSTGTLQRRAVFQNADGTLLPGIFGRIRVPGSEEYEATLVPDEVIGTNQNQKFVYVVGEGNTVQPRPVVLGPLHDGNMRIIRSGLTSADQVIVSGLTILRPGMPITPMPANPPQAAEEGAAADGNEQTVSAEGQE
ncbi:MAG: efflux RND transporter periplasmic adaptor subunit [Proteobacteria bacterium]|nr:efflux RND transporter periplasmic adaptor subunit [Pseudomonadota bacterium]